MVGGPILAALQGACAIPSSKTRYSATHVNAYTLLRTKQHLSLTHLRLVGDTRMAAALDVVGAAAALTAGFPPE